MQIPNWTYSVLPSAFLDTVMLQSPDTIIKYLGWNFSCLSIALCCAMFYSWAHYSSSGWWRGIDPLRVKFIYSNADQDSHPKFFCAQGSSSGHTVSTEAVSGAQGAGTDTQSPFCHLQQGDLRLQNDLSPARYWRTGGEGMVWTPKRPAVYERTESSNTADHRPF